MKLPDLPKNLIKTMLTKDSFRSDEDYVGLRFEGGTFEGEKAEHLSLQQVHFQGVSLDDAVLYAPTLKDVRLKVCSLANTNCERINVHRAAFVNCRLVGWHITNGHFQDVKFRECDIQMGHFRFCSFKSVRFEDCNLENANFQGADLSGIHFKRCNLSNAEMSQAKLAGTDFRTSKIDGLRVGTEEVVGAVVDHFQAAYMAGLLGLIIKGEDEA